MRIPIGVVAAAAVALGGCGGDSSDAEPSDTSAPAAVTATAASTIVEAAETWAPEPELVLAGTFTLIDSNVSGRWDECGGTGGYSDFGAGMNVTIRDGDGNVIGAGSTRSIRHADADDERFAEEFDTATEPAYADISCMVVFEIPVKDAEFYQVGIGSRGTTTYTRDDLVAAGWTLHLTLG